MVGRIRRRALGAALGVFAGLAGQMAAAAGAVAGPALHVDTTRERHAISPDIYGMNFADPALADELGITVDRWGGNAVETYNWELGSKNTSNDWYFENTADCFAAPDWTCTPDEEPEYRRFVATNLAAGRKPLITVPLMGYVAKDAPPQHPFSCSFPRTQFPLQKSFDPYDSNCGNGLSTSGARLTADPTTAGKAVDASYAAAWIADLQARYGAAHAGGVRLYELGNEPNLWGDTHRDMHAAPTTYDELLEKSLAAAEAIKAADLGAKVIAFSEWGWPHYFCSAKDTAALGYCAAAAPDRAAHGGTPLVEWLLQGFSARSAAVGKRLVDYIDVHYYRQGGDSIAVTRSLWDPAYVDPSWINDTIRLLPRMHEWVAANYPGTRLAITEYNLSIGGKPRLNALIQAEVLGLFARERLDLATRWDMPDDGDAAAQQLLHDAFRLYRNYDGAHGRFGETYVRSRSSNPRRMTIFAAERAADRRLTIVVINKSGQRLSSPLAVNGAALAGKAQVWRWVGSGIGRVADQVVDGRAHEFPPLSMTLYVVPLAP